MDNKEIPDEDSQQLDSARVNRALGVFLLMFGLLVLLAVFFTETVEGRLTNLVAGLVLVMIGGLMVFNARKA